MDESEKSGRFIDEQFWADGRQKKPPKPDCRLCRGTAYIFEPFRDGRGGTLRRCRCGAEKAA